MTGKDSEKINRCGRRNGPWCKEMELFPLQEETSWVSKDFVRHRVPKSYDGFD